MRTAIIALATTLVLAACTAPPPTAGMTIRGVATAGPFCPVVTEPPDPACADRPVSGAEIVVHDEAGEVIGRVRTGADGSFSMPVAAGRYELVPQPVEGLMGTAAPIAVVVVDGRDPEEIVVIYDTGIR